MTEYIIEEYIPEENDKYSTLLSILDNFPDVIIAGGVFKDIHNKIYPKDIDLFFRNNEDFEKTVIKMNKTFYLKYDKKNSACFVMYNNRAVSYDAVRKYFGTPQEIIESFDFILTKIALFKENDKYFMIRHLQALQHIQDRMAIIDVDNPSPNHSNEVERLHRYVHSYGYNTDTRSFQYVYDMLRKNNDELANISCDEVLQKYSIRKFLDKFAVDNGALADHYEKVDSQNNIVRKFENHYYYQNKQDLMNTYARALERFFNYYGNEDIFPEVSHRSILLLNFFNNHAEDEVFAKNKKKIMKIMGRNFMPYLSNKFENGYITVQELQKQKNNIDTWTFDFTKKKKDTYTFYDILTIISSDYNIADYWESTNGETSVLYKIFTHNNSEQWIQECCDFFEVLYDTEDLDERPTYQEWVNSLDNDLFTPEIHPTIMFSLMIDVSEGFQTVEEILNKNNIKG